MFASSAVDDADERSPAPAAMLVLFFVILLKLQSSGGLLFRPDPFRQSAAQAHARRGRMGQVLLEARRLHRLLQIGMADATPGQPPCARKANERKLGDRGYQSVHVTNVHAITHKDSSLLSIHAARSISFSLAAWRHEHGARSLRFPPRVIFSASGSN